MPESIDPITPHESDIVSGSVFTDERRGMNRWTPRWGGRPSILDGAALGAILTVAVVVLVVWLL